MQINMFSSFSFHVQCCKAAEINNTVVVLCYPCAMCVVQMILRASTIPYCTYRTRTSYDTEHGTRTYRTVVLVRCGNMSRFAGIFIMYCIYFGFG